MAPSPTKHGRDQALDFQGFLNDLQDWELSLKDKDKKMKSQVSNKASSSSRTAAVGEEKRTAGVNSKVGGGSNTGWHNSSSNYKLSSSLSSTFSTDESVPDATSEKELGNEFFKQKKYNEAIDCYSRSIAFSPTAVAYANRGMAYLKIKRFREAEEDCTEALNLDDRYIKAYSRRATARKELGKFKESFEDAEFALRLEPDNQEIKKQYAEAKAMYEKEILKKASGALQRSVERMQKGGKAEDGQHVTSTSSSGQKTGASKIQDHSEKSNGSLALKPAAIIEEVKTKRTVTDRKTEPKDYSLKNDTPISASEDLKRNARNGKQKLRASVQELANRASSLAVLEAAKNITQPKSAYQFEVAWKGFSGNRSLQAQLLKVTSPGSLPQIFKNALSTPLLSDIIKCVATFFSEDVELAVGYLDNLTKVPRFDMLVMCLSSAEKSELTKTWDEVFCGEATPIEYAEILDSLSLKYGVKR
ncbi:hypothetical protein CDL15_Pgr020193 [Punica granatum]|uniref:RNA-polymerase II-associated protein 3-like C-terminal domain-containing protein n=1 Tax=Punica granatum TaxID=22663 RepID=A0A218VRG3_PUNGR|nr:hypothetical protein CDL15_Pgr020193 [Punica granatum]